MLTYSNLLYVQRTTFLYFPKIYFSMTYGLCLVFSETKEINGAGEGVKDVCKEDKRISRADLEILPTIS